LDDDQQVENQFVEWKKHCLKTQASPYSRKAFCTWLASVLPERKFKGWMSYVERYDARRRTAGKKPICSR
jgi:hypothetical protein